MNILKRLLFSFVIGISLVTLPFLPGCALFRQTPSQQKVVVNTLFSIHETVDKSFDAYLDLVISGQLATNALPKVGAAYNNFQQAFRLAVVLVAGQTNTLAPQSVADAAATFALTVDAARKGSL